MGWILFALILGGTGFAVFKLATQKHRNVDEDVSCAACASTNLEVLAERVYRCRDCSYEGGSGRAALREQKRTARWRAATPEQRSAEIARIANEARLVLSSCQGRLGGRGGSRGLIGVALRA